MNKDEIKSILNESQLRMLGMRAFEAGDPNNTGSINLDTIKKLVNEFAEGTKHTSPTKEFYDNILKTLNKTADDKFVIDDFILLFKTYLEDLIK